MGLIISRQDGALISTVLPSFLESDLVLPLLLVLHWRLLLVLLLKSLLVDVLLVILVLQLLVLLLELLSLEVSLLLLKAT